MFKIDTKKLVLFGAGKIGRSFIGQIFSRNGFQIVFVDIDKQIIDELNLKKRYKVIFRAESDEVIEVRNVKGIHLSDKQKVINETATAGIIAVSVGTAGLKHIFPVIAKGLILRQKQNKNQPIDIIIAENLRDAKQFFLSQLSKHSPLNFPISSYIGLVETSIGKMVPLMKYPKRSENILDIFAEPYNTLILSKNAFLNPIPKIHEFDLKESIKAWVDQKLFVHNMGHAATAYIGHLVKPEIIFIHEVLAIAEIKEFIKETMMQASEVLIKLYPDEFNYQLMKDYVDNLIERFQNKALGDTVFRVGCDLMRKLGDNERFAGLIKTAIDVEMPFEKILTSLICGFYFRACGPDGMMLSRDDEFISAYNNDTAKILTGVCKFNPTQNNNIYLKARLIAEKIEHYRPGKISFKDLVSQEVLE